MLPHLGQQHPHFQQQQHPQQQPFGDARNQWQLQSMMQMRNQSANPNDIPMQQQMADFLRSQNANRMQNLQQNNNNFGLSMQSPNQQPSFLDQSNNPHNPHNSANPQNPQNRISSLGFSPNQMNNNANPSMNPNINTRQMIMQLQQSPHNRQLELINMAQNQQNQNAPINRMGMHQGGLMGGMNGGMNGSMGMNGGNAGMGGMNASPHQNSGGMQQGDFNAMPNDLRRPSPHHMQQSPQPPMQPQMTMMNNMNGNKRVITLPELQERHTSVKNQLAQLELQMKNLIAGRAQLPEPVFTTKMRQFQMEMQQKRENFAKIGTLMNQMIQSSQTSMTLPFSGPPVSGGQPWMGGAGGGQGPNSMMNSPPQPVPSPALNTTPAMTATSPNNLPQQGRSNPPSFPNSNPPSAGFGANPNTPPTFVIPPLPKDRFAISYKSWCTSKNISHDPRVLNTEHLSIDLHALHTEVIKEGGIGPVMTKDLWPVIAGRLGSVQFPASANEQPRSGPAAANQVRHAYEQYLQEFDGVYMSSVQENRRKQLMFQQQLMNNPTFGNVLSGLNGGKGVNPTQMRMLVSYANKSVQEMRSERVSEDVIRMVESVRTHLQHMSRDQNLFRTTLAGLAARDSAQGQGQGQPGAGPGGPGGFGPGPGGVGVGQPQLQKAMQDIAAMKQEYVQRMIPTIPQVEIPPEQRLEYNNVLEQTHQRALDMDRKLPIFYTLQKNEQSIKKVISLICNVTQQRQMIGFSTPRFIMSLQELKTAHAFLMSAVEFTVKAFNSGMHSGMSAMGGGPNPGMGPGGQQVPLMAQRPPQLLQQQQPLQQSSPPQHSLPPQVPPQQHPSPNMPTHQNLSSPPPNQLNRPLPNLHPPPNGPKKKNQSISGSAASPPGAVSTPTPPPMNPSTPAATNAPTPTHAGSPSTPKSPKTKVPPKPRKQQARRSSMASKATPPTVEPPEPPTATSTQAMAGVKRQREEEEASGSGPGPAAASEPSPPKRIKTEWEGPTSDALKKKTDTVDNIKTEEDASTFLEQMTQLIQMKSGADETSTLGADISETLDMLLKGYTGMPDTGEGIDSLGGTSAVGASEGEFSEFFDFSSFGALDEDDKPDTPELIHSSLTNPSPESGSETDHPPVPGLGVGDAVKTEEFGGSDLLRLGTLKEIDGGESAYYQSNEWRWDQPMTTLDQPWAIFGS